MTRWPHDARYDELDSALATMAKERDLSGTVLLTRAGETLFEECYGLADRAADLRITPRTRFALASVTKLFTTAAALDLVNAAGCPSTTRSSTCCPPSAGRRRCDRT